jgi:hypothetical protein
MAGEGRIIWDSLPVVALSIRPDNSEVFEAKSGQDPRREGNRRVEAVDRASRRAALHRRGLRLLARSTRPTITAAETPSASQIRNKVSNVRDFKSHCHK